jgi:hypothetical protein
MSSPQQFSNRLGRILTPITTLLLGLGALILNNSAMAKPSWPPHHKPPCVPEMNSGLVLVPIVIALLLFSSRHILRRRQAPE